MAHLGPVELGILLIVVVLVFGVGKLPEVGSALGKGIRGFRRSMDEDEDQPQEAKADQEDCATV